MTRLSPRQLRCASLAACAYLTLSALAYVRPDWQLLRWLSDAVATASLAGLGWHLARPTASPPADPVHTERFQLIADAVPLPLLLNRSSDGSILYANPQAVRMFGLHYPPPEHNQVQALYADPARRDSSSATLLGVGAASACEIELIGAEQQRFWALVASSLLRLDGELLVISSFHDISDRKQLEQRLHASNGALQRHIGQIERLQQDLHEQATRDALTGLYNRRHLDSMLPCTLALMQRQHLPLSVLLLDADQFKRVNDSYGHQTGDLVLAAIGQAMRDGFRATDLLCRYGGEEFVVVLPATALAEAELKAGQLRRQLEQTSVYAPDGRAVRFTVSIGVACAPLHGSEAEYLLRQADEALYCAKSGGRNRVCLASLPVQS